MRYSSLRAGSRLASLALLVLPAWACATAQSNTGIGDESDGVDANAGANTSAGTSASAGAGNGAAGGALNGGAGAGSTFGGAGSGSGQGGAATSGAAGMTGSAGKGGASNGAGGSPSMSGANSGGASNSGGAGKSAGGASNAGSTSAGGGGGSSAGASSGGATGSGTCDAAHALATIGTGNTYTGKATDCVRLSVNPTWAVVMIQMQPQPGTASYPVPFKFFGCAGNGTGSLTSDYTSATLKSGDNPGCDYYVQFSGGNGALKFTYYD